MQKILFICVPRLDFSYALKPQNSGSNALWLFTRYYGNLIGEKKTELDKSVIS
jgi:hypothetical protein